MDKDQKNVKQKWFSSQINDVLNYKVLPLKALERLVLIAIASRCYKSGQCTISLREISNFTGIKRHNLYRYFSVLKSYGVLSIKQNRKGIVMGNNTYKINIKALIELSVSPKGVEVKINGEDISQENIKVIHSMNEECTEKEGGGVLTERTGCSHSEEVVLRSKDKANKSKSFVHGETMHNKTNVKKSVDYSTPFLEFWKVYPRKENKKGTYKIWKRDKLDALGDKIVKDVVERLAKHERWSDNKRTVNHIDHNKLNNDLANLEWSTDSENIAHSYTSKTRGSSLKLSNQDLKEIAKEFFSGASLTELAKKHGVSTATLSTKLPKVVDDLGAYYIELRAQKKLRQGKCNANRNK